MGKTYKDQQTYHVYKQFKKHYDGNVGYEEFTRETGLRQELTVAQVDVGVRYGNKRKWMAHQKVWNRRKNRHKQNREQLKEL